MNAEQAEDWNGASGRDFIEQREWHERMLGRLRVRLLAAAAIRDGEDVLDVGCGCGETTIMAARAAGSGRALGADFSRIQVDEARRLAAAANTGFEVADAQVHRFGTGVFDVVLSSFGVMFFDDPAAAFDNLRTALRSGGRMAFVCWRTRAENPVFTTGFAAAAAELGLREMPGPGAAFSLASTGRVSGLLRGAGFGDIGVAAADEPMLIGRDVEDMLEYERTSPTAQEVLTGLSPEQAAGLVRPSPDDVRVGGWRDHARRGLAGHGAGGMSRRPGYRGGYLWQKDPDAVSDRAAAVRSEGGGCPQGASPAKEETWLSTSSPSMTSGCPSTLSRNCARSPGRFGRCWPR